MQKFDLIFFSRIDSVVFEFVIGFVLWLGFGNFEVKNLLFELVEFLKDARFFLFVESVDTFGVGEFLAVDEFKSGFVLFFEGAVSGVKSDEDFAMIFVRFVFMLLKNDVSEEFFGGFFG